MKKTCKHYIEKIYIDGESKKDKLVSEIEETSFDDPLLVDYDSGLIGFRFFDVDSRFKGLIKADNATICSPMYYLGQRVTVNDEEGVYISVDLMINYLRSRGLESAIFCKGGVIIKDIPEGAMTISEVNKDVMKKKGEMYVFDEESFFKGLACCLAHAGCDITYMVSDSYWPLTDDIDLESEDEEVSVRTYSIYEDGYELVNKSSVLNGSKLGNLGDKTYINLNQIMDVVKPLYQEHPYLTDLMNTVKNEVLSDKVVDVGERMLDIAIDTFVDKDACEDTFIYEKS